jgi:hypothetical protein
LQEAEALLCAFIDGDGSRAADGRIAVYQKGPECLDVLQAVAVRLGWKTSLRWYESQASSAKWALALTSGPAAILRNNNAGSLIGVESYSGTVWCPTTGTGTFVARRSGHVFVTGNSYGPEYDRGLLFGKYSGRFWVPAFARGVAGDAAPAQRDYVLKP